MSEHDAPDVDPEQPAVADDLADEDRAAIQTALLDLLDRLVVRHESLDVLEQEIAELSTRPRRPPGPT